MYVCMYVCMYVYYSIRRVQMAINDLYTIALFSNYFIIFCLDLLKARCIEGVGVFSVPHY